MSLTEKALYERRWGRFPQLSKILDDSEPGVRWIGGSSSSNNIFDDIENLLKVSALVLDHEDEVKQFLVKSQEHNMLADKELSLLTAELMGVAEFLKRHAEEINEKFNFIQLKV
jgi:hypothetical protein